MRKDTIKTHLLKLFFWALPQGSGFYSLILFIIKELMNINISLNLF